MNKIYRLIWSEILNAWVAVSEIVKTRGKRSSRVITSAIVLSALTFGNLSIAGPPGVNELPTGGSVAAGSASISQSSNTMTIQQATQRAVLDWNTFNIGQNATVNINQLDASSVLLNNILGNNPSQVYGALNANGQVFLSNPSGLLRRLGPCRPITLWRAAIASRTEIIKQLLLMKVSFSQAWAVTLRF